MQAGKLKVSSFRSSRPKVFCKKGVLRNFVKFTGKHLCQSHFFNKVALLKKRLRHRCFPVNFAKFLRTPFLQNTFGRLLLNEDTFNLPACTYLCHSNLIDIIEVQSLLRLYNSQRLTGQRRF